MGKLTTLLRSGDIPHKNVVLRDGIKAVVVLLPLDLTTQIEEQTEQYMNENKDKVNDTVRLHFFNKMLCYHCLRDPDDTTFETRLAENPAEIGALFDMEDVNRVANAYGELMMDKAPRLDLLTEQEYDELKKFLEVTPLTDLSIVSHVHLINFHQTIASNN